jgi:hypothetical protein
VRAHSSSAASGSSSRGACSIVTGATACPGNAC